MKFREQQYLPCPVCGQSCRAEVALRDRESRAYAPEPTTAACRFCHDEVSTILCCAACGGELEPHLIALSPSTASTDGPAGFYTDENGDEWLCVGVGGKVHYAWVEEAIEVSRELFDKYAWTPSDRTASVIAHEREALAEIERDLSAPDRATVHEGNAFEHFSKLNKLLVSVRDKARAGLAQSRNERGGPQS